jgi:hypothetical protein
MTLPTDWILPLNEDRLDSGDPVLIGDYIRELVSSLESIYRDLSQATNGDIRQFTPTILGLTTPGVGTYTVQDGWYLRKGLMVDYWFALQWTAHTGTGFASIQLPYKVKNTISAPFVGHVHGIYNYSAAYNGMFGLCAANTFQYNLYAEAAAGAAFVSLQLLTSGTLFGHIRYIGQEIENSQY